MATTWKVAPAAEWTTIEDEIIVLSMATGEYFALEESAMAIWLRLVDGATEAELVAALAAEFAAERTVLEQDVLSFVEDLASEGLVTAVEDEREDELSAG